MGTNTKEELLAAYVKQNDTLTKLEKATEITKAARAKLAKALFEAHGKGPYIIDGEEKFIFNKGDTFFFSSPRGKGPGKKSEEASSGA